MSASQIARFSSPGDNDAFDDKHQTPLNISERTGLSLSKRRLDVSIRNS